LEEGSALGKESRQRDKAPMPVRGEHVQVQVEVETFQ
jgi:hypothetical protein